MEWVRRFFSLKRPISGSNYALLALFSPLLIIHIAEGRIAQDRTPFDFYLIIAPLYALIWPLATMRRLVYLRLSRLWTLPILLPLAFLALELYMHWSHKVDAIALLLSLAVQAPLVFLSPRKALTTTESVISGDSHP
jgi:hypothetical protein